MLSQAQIDHFYTFGFIRMPEVFSMAEMQSISAAAEHVFSKDEATHPFNGLERQQIQGFVEQHPELIDLLADERIARPVRCLLGPDLIWIGSDGNRYIAETGWHPDGSNLVYRRIKLAFYLEPLCAKTGALRVISGSHQDPMHSDLLRLLQRPDWSVTPYGVMASRRSDRLDSGFGVPAVDLPSFALVTNPGDLVAFDQNIWHSSFGGRVGRTMFTMNFGAPPRTEADWEFVDQMYHGQLEHVRTRQWSRKESVFGGRLLADKRPLIRDLVRHHAVRNWR